MRTNNYLSIEPSLSRTQSDNKKAHLASLKQKRDDWKTIEIDKFLFFISLRQKKRFFVFCQTVIIELRKVGWIAKRHCVDETMMTTLYFWRWESSVREAAYWIAFFSFFFFFSMSKLIFVYFDCICLFCTEKKTKQKCTKIPFRHFLYFAV